MKIAVKKHDVVAADEVYPTLPLRPEIIGWTPVCVGTRPVYTTNGWQHMLLYQWVPVWRGI